MRATLAVLTFWVPIYSLAWLLCGFFGVMENLSPAMMDAMDVCFGFTVILCVGLVPYYLLKVWRNEAIESKAVWVLAILSSPLVFMPAYLIKYGFKGQDD